MNKGGRRIVRYKLMPDKDNNTAESLREFALQFAQPAEKQSALAIASALHPYYDKVFSIDDDGSIVLIFGPDESEEATGVPFADFLRFMVDKSSPRPVDLTPVVTLSAYIPKNLLQAHVRKYLK